MQTKRQEHLDVLKFFTKLSLQVAILFIIAIVYSFLTEYLQQIGFFGDKLLPKPDGSTIDNTYSWGTRHILFFWMSILLFIIQFVRVICYAVIEGGHTFLTEEERKNRK